MFGHAYYAKTHFQSDACLVDSLNLNSIQCGRSVRHQMSELVILIQKTPFSFKAFPILEPLHSSDLLEKGSIQEQALRQIFQAIEDASEIPN